MSQKECLKGERDLNCAPWYSKAVNYNYDYSENTEKKTVFIVEKK